MSRDKARNPRSEHDAISDLYHASSAVEPPEHLDDAILAASRRGVSVKSKRRAFGPFSGRWPIPASMAAVLIIAVVLVPLLKHGSEMPQTIPELIPGQHETPKSAKSQELELKREAAPALSPPELDKFKTIVPPEPMDQAPMLPATPAKKDMRLYSKELRMSPAESVMQEPEAEISKDNLTSPPAKRLAQIRRLMEAGRIDEARTQLQRFLSRYPDYPLDASLSKLLDESEPASHDDR